MVMQNDEVLREQFNPEGSNLRDAQKRLLELLLWVDEICKRYEIPYFLESGSLLGAVRHKGFIPWDDDIDIGVPYEYYNRLKQILLKENHSRFVLQSEETDPYAFNRWLVVRDKNSRYVHTTDEMIRRESLKKYTGLQVDIFPYDNRVNPFIRRVLSYDFSGKIIICFGTGRRARNLALFVTRLFTLFAKVVRKIIPESQFWSYGYGCNFQFKAHHENSLFPFSEVEFENNKFPAPNNPDKFLKTVYGNYMELPPIKEFNHHHLKNIEIW